MVPWLNTCTSHLTFCTWPNEIFWCHVFRKHIVQNFTENPNLQTFLRFENFFSVLFLERKIKKYYSQNRTSNNYRNQNVIADSDSPWNSILGATLTFLNICILLVAEISHVSPYTSWVTFEGKCKYITHVTRKKLLDRHLRVEPNTEFQGESESAIQFHFWYLLVFYFGIICILCLK